MKRFIVCALALAIVAASTAADAQVGGILRRKAGEVMGKKPEPAKPAPEPAKPAPAPAPATGTAAPAAPAPAASGTRETTTAPKADVSPLDPSALPLRDSANQVLRDRMSTRENGDWQQLPYIPAAATAAAYGLNDSARVTLVETVGAALKTFVMSAAYVAEHDAYVKGERKGVDHGLKGVVTVEQAAQKQDFKTMEALQVRMMVALTVDGMKTTPPQVFKNDLTQNLPRWKERAADPKNSKRAKFQKMVAKAESIEALPASDEKFLRGYATIKSIDSDGPDTEEAVYAMAARFNQEQEQAAYDEYSLKGQLKQQLTTFIAIASKVNFNAPTVEKNKQTVFVNAADERQGAIWKACFRAGQPATAAAVKLAKAWLSEL